MTIDDQYVCTLSNELQDRACKELGEVPSRRDADIKAIREWMDKNQYLNADRSARSIMMFLRTCKFSLERTKERIEMYYTVKGALPDFFSNFDPMLPKIQAVIQSGVIIPLEGKDKLGRRIFLHRSAAADPEKHGMENIVRAFNMVYYVAMNEFEDMSVTGLVVVEDHKNYKASMLKYMNPTLMRKSAKLWQECTPLRFKASHQLNNSAIVQTVFKMFKPFIKEKMLKRIQFHENLDSLYEHIPQEVMPKEYGGNAGTVEALAREWKKKVESKREWLIGQEKYVADESKRPGPKRDLDAELFGIEGSFRKLEID